MNIIRSVYEWEENVIRCKKERMNKRRLNSCQRLWANEGQQLRETVMLWEIRREWMIRIRRAGWQNGYLERNWVLMSLVMWAIKLLTKTHRLSKRVCIWAMRVERQWDRKKLEWASAVSDISLQARKATLWSVPERRDARTEHNSADVYLYSSWGKVHLLPA
jgi:hypothetical protein